MKIVLEKPRRTRRRRVTAIAILTILLAVSAFIVWRAEELRQQVTRGRDEIQVAVAALTKKPLLELGRDDFEAAMEHLRSAEEALRPAHDELGYWEPALNLLGGDAGAIPPLVDTALEIAIAGQQLYMGLEPLLEPFLSPPEAGAGSASEDLTVENNLEPALTDDDNLEDVVTQLRARQPQLREADKHLQLALAAYSQIDKSRLSGEIAESVSALDRYTGDLQTLHEFAGVLASAPDLLASFAGMGSSKTYLLLGQNNDELRPTGGFIGTFGVLVVSDGAIVVYKYSSTSEPYLKPPTEPCPDPSPPWWIKLKEPAWGCWDAQWTADFPTLARETKWFYEQGENEYAPVDGVIAIDQTAFELLLDALGSVQIPGGSEKVTAENFRSRVYLHPDAASPEPHKQFLAALFQALIERDLKRIDPSRARALVPTLVQAVAGKHLLFYFEDSGLQTVASLLGIDGSIKASRGDYLFVVDTSLYDKVYDSVRQHIEYEARLDESGSVNARTTITWTYSASAAANDPAIIKASEKSRQAPFLLNLTRIYLPGSSVWGSIEGDGTSAYFAGEADKLMAGTRMEVAVGERKQVTYHYFVPSVVDTVDERKIYKLLVQKQPGTRGADLSLAVTLPPGAELISTDPEFDSVTVGQPAVVTFRTQLTTDRTFEVIFR